MLAGKTWVDFTSLCSPYDFERNDDTVFSYFKDEWNLKNTFVRTDKTQTKLNNRKWKLFLSRNQSKKIMQ